MSLWILWLVFGAGLAGGWAALFLKKRSGNTAWLCLGGTFAGGAFLGSSVFGLIPEAVGGLGWLKTLLVGGGFLLGLRWLDRRTHHAHAEVHGHHQHGGSASLSLVLGGVLGLHSLLEGLALGCIQSGAVQQALAVAILMHKATETFALAITMGRKGASHGAMLGATVLLSLATPAGAWLALQADRAGASQMHGILAAATAGTFLYLAYADLLVPELKEKEGRMGKMVSAGVGFALLAAVAHRHVH